MNREELITIMTAWDPHTAADIIVKKYGWQPIETAPKDGTEILVWANMFNPIYKHVVPVEGLYMVSWQTTWTGGGINAIQVDAWCVSGSLDSNDDVWDRVYPTHWMPLPDKP